VTKISQQSKSTFPIVIFFQGIVFSFSRDYLVKYTLGSEFKAASFPQLEFPAEKYEYEIWLHSNPLHSLSREKKEICGEKSLFDWKETSLLLALLLRWTLSEPEERVGEKNGGRIPNEMSSRLLSFSLRQGKKRRGGFDLEREGKREKIPSNKHVLHEEKPFKANFLWWEKFFFANGTTPFSTNFWAY